jgi:hypothetical protein
MTHIWNLGLLIATALKSFARISLTARHASLKAVEVDTGSPIEDGA